MKFAYYWVHGNTTTNSNHNHKVRYDRNTLQRISNLHTYLYKWIILENIYKLKIFLVIQEVSKIAKNMILIYNDKTLKTAIIRETIFGRFSSSVVKIKLVSEKKINPIEHLKSLYENF